MIPYFGAVAAGLGLAWMGRRARRAFGLSSAVDAVGQLLHLGAALGISAAALLAALSPTSFGRELAILTFALGLFLVEAILWTPVAGLRRALLARRLSRAAEEAEESDAADAPTDSSPEARDYESPANGGGRDSEEPESSPDETAEVGTEHLEDGDLEPKSAEQELPPEGKWMLERIKDCERLAVDAIMVPRARVEWLEGRTPAGEALARMRALGRSRLLVAEGSLDRVLGIVHAKDLVPLVQDGDATSPIHNHLKRWLRITAGRPVAALLEDFRHQRVHLGVVVDGRGSTLGLVTLRDVFSFVVRGSETTEARP